MQQVDQLELVVTQTEVCGCTQLQMLAVRDLIIVCDTNVPTTNFVNVLSNTGTVVDVSDGTAVVETDGD